LRGRPCQHRAGTGHHANAQTENLLWHFGNLDSRLLGGAALFGIGWGLAGYCPGPGIAALVMGLWEPALFVVGLLVGMWGFRRLPA